MTRGTDTATKTSLAAPHVTLVVFVEIHLDGGTWYLTSHPTAVEWDGQTWLAAQHIGSIEPVVETDEGAQGLVLTLLAANQAAIASALTEDVQGRKLVMHLGVIDAGVLRVDRAVWSGYLDVQTVQDAAQQPVIRVTAEHAGLRWQQPIGTLFSHQDQQTIDSSDMFFEFAAKMAETTIVWPGKAALE